MPTQPKLSYSEQAKLIFELKRADTEQLVFQNLQLVTELVVNLILVLVDSEH